MLDVGQEKKNLNKDVLNRQLGLKFPELAKETTNLDSHEKRQK